MHSTSWHPGTLALVDWEKIKRQQRWLRVGKYCFSEQNSKELCIEEPKYLGMHASLLCQMIGTKSEKRKYITQLSHMVGSKINAKEGATQFSKSQQNKREIEDNDSDLDSDRVIFVYYFTACDNKGKWGK